MLHSNHSLAGINRHLSPTFPPSSHDASVPHVARRQASRLSPLPAPAGLPVTCAHTASLACTPMPPSLELLPPLYPLDAPASCQATPRPPLSASRFRPTVAAGRRLAHMRHGRLLTTHSLKPKLGHTGPQGPWI